MLRSAGGQKLYAVKVFVDGGGITLKLDPILSRMATAGKRGERRQEWPGKWREWLEFNPFFALNITPLFGIHSADLSVWKIENLMTTVHGSGLAVECCYAVASLCCGVDINTLESTLLREERGPEVDDGG